MALMIRWFILSDSPPEKDIQWSDSGVSSSSKFLQKIWNVVFTIKNREENKGDKKIIKKFESEIDNLVYKINSAVKDFKFNVSIAQFYEAYKIFNNYIALEVSNESLIKNITKIIKMMIPFTPHLAYESLEFLGCRTSDKWPEIREDVTTEIKFAVQVNGKTRDIMTIQKDLGEKWVKELVLKNSKAKKFLDNKNVFKTIFVQNKIINFIIK